MDVVFPLIGRVLQARWESLSDRAPPLGHPRDYRPAYPYNC